MFWNIPVASDEMLSIMRAPSAARRMIGEASLFALVVILYYGVIGPLAVARRLWRLRPMVHGLEYTYWRRRHDFPSGMHFWSRPW